MWFVSFNIVWHHLTIKRNLDAFSLCLIGIGLGILQCSLCGQRGFGAVIGVTCKDKGFKLRISQTSKDLYGVFLKMHISISSSPMTFCFWSLWQMRAITYLFASILNFCFAFLAIIILVIFACIDWRCLRRKFFWYLWLRHVDRW